MMLYDGLFIVPIVRCISIRFASTKILKHLPRPYRRRLWEASIAPEIPHLQKLCVASRSNKEAYIAEMNSLTDFEIAIIERMRQRIIDNNIRVMAICQMLPVQLQTINLMKNSLRLKGIELRQYNNRLMLHLFKNTPLEKCSQLFVSSNCVLMGESLDALRIIKTATDTNYWLYPLAFAIDNRILSRTEAYDLIAYPNFNYIPAQTVATLARIPQTTVNLLDQAMRQLTMTIDQIATTPAIKNED